jgi:hypothetical protein
MGEIKEFVKYSGLDAYFMNKLMLRNTLSLGPSPPS